VSLLLLTAVRPVRVVNAGALLFELVVATAEDLDAEAALTDAVLALSEAETVGALVAAIVPSKGVA
jgi:hypothetical protein